jgi:hypothetical protein
MMIDLTWNRRGGVDGTVAEQRLLIERSPGYL